MLNVANKPIMLSVFMLSVVMQSVFMLSVIMLSVMEAQGVQYQTGKSLKAVWARFLTLS
jgi:hypothetical protein